MFSLICSISLLGADYGMDSNLVRNFLLRHFGLQFKKYTCVLIAQKLTHEHKSTAKQTYFERTNIIHYHSNRYENLFFYSLSNFTWVVIEWLRRADNATSIHAEPNKFAIG